MGYPSFLDMPLGASCMLEWATTVNPTSMTLGGYPGSSLNNDPGECSLVEFQVCYIRTLHYFSVPFRFIPLHYIKLHCITSIYPYIHPSIHTYITYIYIYIYVYIYIHVKLFPQNQWFIIAYPKKSLEQSGVDDVDDHLFGDKSQPPPGLAKTKVQPGQ